MMDKAQWRVRYRVEKWHDGNTRRPPDQVIEGEGNVLTTAGINALWTALTGGAITPFNNTNAHIGVGDGTTAASASDTDLSGTTTTRLPMDAGYPAISGNRITFRATAAGATANHAWNEWGVFNAATGGTMLNHKVESFGTKASGAVWTLTVDITIS